MEKIVNSYIANRHAASARNIKAALMTLKENIEHELKLIDAGKHLNSHLISNASQVTHDIGVYNITLDMKDL